MAGKTKAKAAPFTDAQRSALAILTGGPRHCDELARFNGRRMAEALARKGAVTVDDEGLVAITDMGRAAVARYQAHPTVADPELERVVGRLVAAPPAKRRPPKTRAGERERGPGRVSSLPVGGARLRGDDPEPGGAPTVVRQHGTRRLVSKRTAW